MRFIAVKTPADSYDADTFSKSPMLIMRRFSSERSDGVRPERFSFNVSPSICGDGAAVGEKHLKASLASSGAPHVLDVASSASIALLSVQTVSAWQRRRKL